jgi:hypothetical protein
MGTLERTENLSHRLGTSGRLSVKAVTGKLTVRGIEGEEARVTIRYRIRATDEASAERALETGRVLVERSDGRLSIETPERRLSTGLAWLMSGARVSADISVDVPWGTRVRLETMNGSIQAADLTGEQRYRTISGNVGLWSLAGAIDVGSVSGSISLDRGGEVWLRANTVSGSIHARADRFGSLALSTTSGGIYVHGALDPGGQHRADSISGSVELTALSGVRAELKTISGSIQSTFGTSVEGTRGAWRATVGDGRALFRVNSTSGGLRLVAAQPATGAPAAGAAEPASGPASAESSATESSATEPAAGGWSAEAESSDEVAREIREDEELAILAALERGEIGVDEASDLLERRGGGGHVR